MTEIQNSKQKTTALNRFGIWNLRFIYNLLARRLSGGVLVICKFIQFQLITLFVHNIEAFRQN